jgi:hypothetical protein
VRNLLIVLVLFAAVGSGGLLAQSTKPVTLEWDCPSCAADEVTEFRLYESLACSDPTACNFSQVATIAVDQLSHQRAITLNTGKHWFYVTAVNWGGESGPSNVVQLNTNRPVPLIININRGN